jgi:toxin CcdB
MAQFDVHRAAGRSKPPYFLVLQSDLVRAVKTVVVAPLYLSRESATPNLPRLHPIFAIGEAQMTLMPTLMAAVQRNFLGAQIASLAEHRNDIIAAIDLLFTGI